jgi:hypothetical protein
VWLQFATWVKNLIIVTKHWHLEKHVGTEVRQIHSSYDTWNATAFGRKQEPQKMPHVILSLPVGKLQISPFSTFVKIHLVEGCLLTLIKS